MIKLSKRTNLVAILLLLGFLFLVPSCKTTKKSGCYYTHEDIEALSRIINAECGTCSIDERYLVASVVVNRAEKCRKTVLEVIREEGQFMGYLSPNYVSKPVNDAIAEDVLFNICRNRNVYYFYKGSPKWAENLTVVPFENMYHTFARN